MVTRRKTTTNTTTSKTEKVPEETFKCLSCGKDLKKSLFYKSYDAVNTLNIIPYCKNCIKKMVVDDNGMIDMNKLKLMLEKIDRPFLYDYWEKSVNDKRETLGIYIKNLALPQNRDLRWKDSVFEKENEIDIDKKENNISSNAEYKKSQINQNDLEKLEDKWGEGYTSEEYRLFEKKYKKLIDNYGEKTSLHTEGLLTYIRFRVREEMATAKGDTKEAKEWGALASKAASDAKLNVSQLSKNDISGGVDLVCQIFEAVETELGVISLLPKLLEQPYDDADMVIWSVINYGRELDDKTRVPYRDIWNFYDEMLSEHCKQQGLTESQIKEYKEKRINIFRDLEKLYKEPVYDEE